MGYLRSDNEQLGLSIGEHSAKAISIQFSKTFQDKVGDRVAPILKFY